MTFSIKNNPVDQIDESSFNIPYTTTANIDQYSEIAGNVTTISEQVADVERNKMTRRFNEYSLIPESAAFIEKIDLGIYDETYEGTNYFSLITEYKQTSYESSYTPNKPELLFYEWDVTEITYRKDTQYKNKLVDTLNWERPYDLVTVNTQGINNNDDDNTRKVYRTIADPFVLTIDCNSRIAARIKSDASSSNVSIIAHSDKEIVEGDSYTLNQEIICSKRYITITFTNTNNNLSELFNLDLNLGGDPEPTFVTVEFYGEFLFNFSSPINFNQLVTMEHPEGTALDIRLFPPGKYQQFPDNFWNSGPQPPILEDFNNRTGEARFI